ncbi:MAG: ABC transporter ATP-binding protein [bacterium]
MIEFRNVTYSYGPGRFSLSDFGAVFREGTMTALFGDNGAGKSTVAMLADGLLEPDSGCVRVDGLDTRSSHSLTEIRRKVGMVFQNPDSQFVATTVEREIAFGMENLGTKSSEIRKRVDTLLGLFGVSHLKDRSPRDLSQGEKAIVSLASILALNPKYLILDEPTSHLDRVEAERLWKFIRGLDENTSVMLITQEKEEIERCGRVIALSSGRKTYEGPSEEFLSTARMTTGLTVLARELSSEGVPVLRNPSGVDQLVDSILRSGGRGSKREERGAPFPVELTRSESWIENMSLVDACYVYKKGLPGEKTGVEHVGVDLQRGQFLGVVGPNGSGKTTLLLMLAGLFSPTSGLLLVNGSDARKLRDPRKLRRETGFVFQNPERAFFTDTCMDEIIFGLKNFGVDRPEERAESSLDFVGLTPGDFRKRSPFEISYGEQRRLAVACALSYGPRVVFFDEPTAGLDQEGREFVYDLLLKMKASERAVVLVSHDLGLVLDLSDNVIGLEKGRVAYAGPPGQFINSSLSEQLRLQKSEIHEVLVRLKSEGLDVDTEIFSPRLAARNIAATVSRMV